MRIVKNDDVGTLARDHTALRSRDAVAAAQIVEAGLLVLIGTHLEAMSPQSLIPGRGDDLPTFDAVTDGESAVIGQVHELDTWPTPAIAPDLELIVRIVIRVGGLCPDPGREEHVGAKRLHVPRRDVDQKAALDLPISDGFQMFADGVNMPITEKRLRLDKAPCRRRKIGKRVLVAERVSALAYCESGQPMSIERGCPK